MSAHAPMGIDLQQARAAHLRELLEPWSLRRLEARTGIGRGTLQGRLNGSTAITMSDIELLAPVIRMTPEELFLELLHVDPAHPATPRPGGGAGRRSLYLLGSETEAPIITV